jgi:hypothetical protein
MITISLDRKKQLDLTVSKDLSGIPGAGEPSFEIVSGGGSIDEGDDKRSAKFLPSDEVGQTIIKVTLPVEDAEEICGLIIANVEDSNEHRLGLHARMSERTDAFAKASAQQGK